MIDTMSCALDIAWSCSWLGETQNKEKDLTPPAPSWQEHLCGDVHLFGVIYQFLYGAKTDIARKCASLGSCKIKLCSAKHQVPEVILFI